MTIESLFHACLECIPLKRRRHKVEFSIAGYAQCSETQQRQLHTATSARTLLYNGFEQLTICK
jgi:hypothetical protein